MTRDDFVLLAVGSFIVIGTVLGAWYQLAKALTLFIR